MVQVLKLHIIIRLNLTRFFNGTLIFSSELAPGLYDANNNLLCTITASEVNSGKSLLSYHPTISGSNVAIVVIPSGATTICSNTVYPMYNIKELILPDTLEFIDEHTFEIRSNLESVDFSKCANLREISSCAFNGDSKLTSVDLSSTQVETIRSGTFLYNSNLTKIKLPSCISRIEYQAFGGCTSLATIEGDISNANVDYYAFRNCHNLDREYDSKSGLWYDGVRHFTINDLVSSGVVQINKQSIECHGVLRSDGPSSFYLPTTRSVIPNDGFSGCIGDYIRLHSEVTYIGDRAFADARAYYIVSGDDNSGLWLSNKLEYVGENAFSYPYFNPYKIHLTDTSDSLNISRTCFQGCRTSHLELLISGTSGWTYGKTCKQLANYFSLPLDTVQSTENFDLLSADNVRFTGSVTAFVSGKSLTSSSYAKYSSCVRSMEFDPMRIETNLSMYQRVSCLYGYVSQITGSWTLTVGGVSTTLSKTGSFSVSIDDKPFSQITITTTGAGNKLITLTSLRCAYKG